MLRNRSITRGARRAGLPSNLKYGLSRLNYLAHKLAISRVGPAFQAGVKLHA
jgi:hypothetical protein